MSTRRVIIAGGGISGLSTAYYLHKAGIPFTIVEASPRLGGLIETRIIQDCVVESGPDSFLTAKPEARLLAEELGLGGELIGSNDHQRATYIWRGGRLVRMPDGMTMMVPSKLIPLLRSDLLSWPGKFRAGFDLFRRPTGPLNDRSIAEFVGDHFGREVLDYIAEPMLAGVYGGDPAQMSALSVTPKFVEWESKYGSLTRAARAEVQPAGRSLFTTFKRGMQSLVDRIVEAIQPEVIHGRIEAVEKGWRVRVNGEWIEARHLVVACRPAAVLPNLFPEISFNPARVVALGYRKADIPSFYGFGFLVPKVERQRISAVTWVPNKFEHRVPEDKILLRCFTTGAPADIEHELKEKLGIAASPLFQQETSWEQAMPLYEVGHAMKVVIIEEMLEDFPGLHVAGNAYYGVGIPDCIRMGKKVAEKIATAS